MRKLRPQQRQVLSLFEKNKEVSSKEIAEHFDIKYQSIRTIVKKWIENGFIEVMSSSKKTRICALTYEWEQALFGVEQDRLNQLKFNKSFEERDLD